MADLIAIGYPDVSSAEQAMDDKAVEGLSRFGGTVLKSSPSKQAEQDLQDALHG
jgi:uncharacterized membrane protein